MPTVPTCVRPPVREARAGSAFRQPRPETPRLDRGPGIHEGGEDPESSSIAAGLDVDQGADGIKL